MHFEYSAVVRMASLHSGTHSASSIMAAAASVAKLLDVHQRRNFSTVAYYGGAVLRCTERHKASSIFLITGRVGASIVCHQKRLGL